MTDMTRPRVARRLMSALVLAAVALASPSAPAQPRQFRIQPEASEVTFKATSRFMNADGRFRLVSGTVVVDPGDWTAAKIVVSSSRPSSSGPSAWRPPVSAQRSAAD